MTDITVQVTGLPDVIERIDAIGPRAADAQHTEIKALGDRYLAVLRDETPVGRGENPGRLRAGYATTETYTNVSAHYRIVNATPHLRYVLQGRGPVVATRARVLRFTIGGQVFFRRSVGPAAPNPFDERARQRMAGEVADAAGRIKARIIGGS